MKTAPTQKDHGELGDMAQLIVERAEQRQAAWRRRREIKAKSRFGFAAARAHGLRRRHAAKAAESGAERFSGHPGTSGKGGSERQETAR